MIYERSVKLHCDTQLFCCWCRHTFYKYRLMEQSVNKHSSVMMVVVTMNSINI